MVSTRNRMKISSSEFKEAFFSSGVIEEVS
jgi:hypothetical protein